MNKKEKLLKNNLLSLYNYMNEIYDKSEDKDIKILKERDKIFNALNEINNSDYLNIITDYYMRYGYFIGPLKKKKHKGIIVLDNDYIISQIHNINSDEEIKELAKYLIKDNINKFKRHINYEIEEYTEQIEAIKDKINMMNEQYSSVINFEYINI